MSTSASSSAVRLETAGLSDIGKRRERNEDQFLIATMKRSMLVEQTTLPLQSQQWLIGGSEGTILVVADGMGGHRGGAIASSMAVNTIADYMCNVMPWVARHAQGEDGRAHESLHGVRSVLASALVEGQSQIHRAEDQAGRKHNMGTTLTMAYVLWPTLYVAHAGDSRCYLFRGGQLEQVTKDHTIAQQLVDQGLASVTDASRWRHVLWNALGGSDAELKPEVDRRHLANGDAILLCSDGLNNHVTDEQIREALQTGEPAASVCKRLVDAANAAGGLDNITVVCARVTVE